jgi:homoserine O-acetyltransferase
VLFSVRSSSDYDPGPMLEQIHAPVLAINFEDDVVNPIQLAPMVRQAIAPVSSARFQSLPGGFGHSSIYHSDPLGRDDGIVPRWSVRVEQK